LYFEVTTHNYVLNIAPSVLHKAKILHMHQYIYLNI
jgi:hypothetical protein